jgi:hypothetical protein
MGFPIGTIMACEHRKGDRIMTMLVDWESSNCHMYGSPSLARRRPLKLVDW